MSEVEKREPTDPVGGPEPLQQPEPQDVSVTGGGTVYLLHLLTDGARSWVEDNVSREGYQPWLPERLVVEHRYVRDIVFGMQQDGLRVN